MSVEEEKPATPNLSRFAVAFTRLLDETSFFNRSGWADFFMVPETTVSSWTSDEMIPRADRLRMLLDLLRLRGGNAAVEPLKAFDALLEEPAHEISPLGMTMMPTLSHYLKQDSFAEFGRTLKGLSPEAAIWALTHT